MIQTRKEKFYDKYSIIEDLGRGAYGTVRKCVRKANSQTVYAVKHIIYSEETPNKYIELEIKIQSSLQSAEVVKIIEYFIEEKNVYLVLEFCNGGTLQKQARTKNYSEDDINNLFLKKFMLKIQCQLIQHGIIHRDLKPDNILIHDGQYKLTDFGISTVVNNYEQNGTITQFSRPNIYSSPQMNDKYSSKCDVWSLGMIIYYLLFKKYPWTVEQQNKILTFPQEKQISNDMKELIKGCLALKEKDRFSWTDVMKRYKIEEYIKLESKLRDIERKTALKLILIIIKKNSNIEQEFRPFFNKENRNQKEKMQLFPFQAMMRKYNEELLQFQIVYIFNQIDKQRNNCIDFQQFNDWINKFYIEHKTLQLLQDRWQTDNEIQFKKLFIVMYLYEEQNKCMHMLFEELNSFFNNNIQNILQQHLNKFQGNRSRYLRVIIEQNKNHNQELLDQHFGASIMLLNILFNQ